MAYSESSRSEAIYNEPHIPRRQLVISTISSSSQSILLLHINKTKQKKEKKKLGLKFQSHNSPDTKSKVK